MILHPKTETEFLNSINKGVVLVDFYATWCGPCKMLSEVIEDLDKEQIKNLTIVKVDVDLLSNVAMNYKVQAVPTIILFKDGKPSKTTLGYLSLNDLKNFLN